LVAHIKLYEIWDLCRPPEILAPAGSWLKKIYNYFLEHVVL